MSDYHKATGPDVDGFSVVEVNGSAYRVVATCGVEADATAIASALNEAEEE
jgi:hypothetical protein